MARTILIVDDDPDAQKLISLILSRAGFQTTVAGNGPEALAQLSQALPDLLILDVMMPGMDGFEVLRRVRGNPATARLPVIMLSAKGEVRDRVTGLRTGADDYITKPADPLELVARVEAVLARVQRSAAAERGRVFAFIGAKGGVGTTTVAINVGAALSRGAGSHVPSAAQRLPDSQVILAELRRGLGSAAAYLGLHPRCTLGDLISDPQGISESAVYAALTAHACGLRLLPAPSDIPELPPCESSFAESLLEHLARSAHFVLLDLAPDSAFIRPLLPRVEAVVVVTNADPISLTGAQILISLARDYGLAGERCCVVLVNRTPGAGMSLSALANALKHPVQAVIPYAAEACLAAAREGNPLILYRPEELASITLIELTSRLTGIEVKDLSSLRTLPR
ncbi:MAG: response regulator [Anaerolineae bacterium]|nr:response regulator [Anaerolineae bacterium]MDW8100062.1 response regulator [Anaerolineae bacterium]